MSCICSCDSTTAKDDSSKVTVEQSESAGIAPALQTQAKKKSDAEGPESRREHYERTGKAPPVPAELSATIPPEDLQFKGYAKEATKEQIEQADLDLERPQQIEHNQDQDQDKDVDEDPNDFGIFVSATGEMWHWLPKDPAATRARIRATNPKVFDLKSSPPSRTALAEDHEELDEQIVRTRQVIGDDTRSIRSEYHGHHMTGFPLHSMGALNPHGTNPNIPDSRCTATKIGPKHLLTAGHCVNIGGVGEDLSGWRYKDWWPGQDGLGAYFSGSIDASPNGTHPIAWYWVHSNWLNNKDDRYDYAVLMLFDHPSVCALDHFGYEVDNTLAGTKHWNFGFPRDPAPHPNPVTHTRVCWGSPDQQEPLCRQSMYGVKRNIVRTNTRFAFYYHDTQGGHSGGPLYQVKNGKRYIHAIHKGAWGSIENRGVKIRSSVYNNIASVISAHPSILCP